MLEVCWWSLTDVRTLGIPWTFEGRLSAPGCLELSRAQNSGLDTLGHQRVDWECLGVFTLSGVFVVANVFPR